MKITPTRVTNIYGERHINGYKIALQKSEVERIGMHAGTELVPNYADGRITLTETDRVIVDYYFKDKLHCFTFNKIGDNLYEQNNFVFPMPADIGKEIEKFYKGSPVPESMLDTSKRSGNLQLIWNDKKYNKDVNY